MAISLVEAYQRHASPRKGFRCAYRAYTGHDSCSAFAIRAIARAGLLKGCALLERRFEKCSAAHAAAGKRRQRGNCDVGDLDCAHDASCADSIAPGCGDDACAEACPDSCESRRRRRRRETDPKPAPGA
jgi:putative component of membrane protein insertase Oxa1/YidC/SpoIIIJ protein YidD